MKLQSKQYYRKLIKTKMEKPIKMTTQKTWDDFRATGLLFLINSLLHAIGWCIAVEVDDATGKVSNAYPMRCKFRGFDEQTSKEEHTKIAAYLAETAPNFPTEIQD
jgi:hypothetical protein